mgnify:CR=1 FL=1
MSGIFGVFFYEDQNKIKEKNINLSKINFLNYSGNCEKNIKRVLCIDCKKMNI